MYLICITNNHHDPYIFNILVYGKYFIINFPYSFQLFFYKYKSIIYFPSTVIIICFRLYAASIHSLKSLLHVLQASFTIMYIHIPSHYLTQYRAQYHSFATDTTMKVQCFANNLKSSKWIIAFKNYMNKKIIFSPTSMCRVTLTLSPFFTGIFIWYSLVALFAFYEIVATTLH